jgi:hypothetical protein
LLAMAKAWMKIAQGEQEFQSNQLAMLDRFQVSPKSTSEPSSRI